MDQQLQATISRLKKSIAASASGDLFAAEEILGLEATWDEKYLKTEGEFSAFLRCFGPGKDLAFFKRRHHAVLTLGRAVCARLYSDAAVWVSRKSDSTMRAATVEKACALFRQQRENPVTEHQIKRIYNALTKHVPANKACANCKALQAIIDRLHEVNRAA